MKRLFILASPGIALLALAGCSGSPDQPASLDQQRAAMHTAAPSAEALKNEMAKVHFKTPGGNMQMPPSGQPVPGAGKTDK